MFLVATVAYYFGHGLSNARAALLLCMVAIWAIRLCAHIMWRNWGKPEHARYQEIRRNNEPYFSVKSLYIVFGLQALLAWIISLPLFAAAGGVTALGVQDYAGVALWVIGMVLEAGGDYQLTRFNASPLNRGQVMDRGLWRYTRHPNYFGEFCIWWGYFLMAVSAGAWWSIVSPVLLTGLLLKVSGVALLEKDIATRRPAYREYTARTNAFFPGPPRRNFSVANEGRSSP